MCDRETKTKNTIIGRLMALFVTGVVCLSQAIPVFADDMTKTTVTLDNNSVVIRVDNTMYYTEPNYGDIIVPVYFNFTDQYNNVYFSGYVEGSISPFNFVDGNSNRYVISYFEDYVDSIDVMYTKTNGKMYLYFDNTLIRNYDYILIGYLHLMGNPGANTLTLTCNNNLQNLNVTTTILYTTEYEYGYVNAMIYALNNSANIEDMLAIMNSIDANMLPEILTVMRSNHTALYNLIQNVWTTDQAVLSVNRNIYNTVLSILAILEDAYAPQASQAEDIKEDVEQNLSNLISDIELTKPSQIANIADDYIDQIDTSYNNLAFGFLSNNTIVLMLCIVAGLAIISYMLYGGQ